MKFLFFYILLSMLYGCAATGPAVYIYKTYGAPSIYEFDGNSYWVSNNLNISRLVISQKDRVGGVGSVGPIQFTPVVNQYLLGIDPSCSVTERQNVLDNAWEYAYICDEK